MKKVQLLANYCFNSILEGCERESLVITGNQEVAESIKRLIEDKFDPNNSMCEVESLGDVKKILRGMEEAISELRGCIEDLENPNYKDVLGYELTEGVYADYKAEDRGEKDV